MSVLAGEIPLTPGGTHQITSGPDWGRQGSRAEMEARMLRTLESLLAVFDAALIRVWRLGPADSCPACAMRDECPVRTRCLHLEASVGVSSRLDGPFRRFPIGARRVGRVFADQRALIVHRDLEGLGLADSPWLE